MVMWNLIGHGVKWAARGIDAFSKTDAGKKTAEVSSRAFSAAKEASKDAVAAYKKSQAARAGTAGAAPGGLRWEAGRTVVASDGRVGVVVRYLTASEVGGPFGDSSFTGLLLIDLLQHTSELDRYLIISENSVRGV